MSQEFLLTKRDVAVIVYGLSCAVALLGHFANSDYPEEEVWELLAEFTEALDSWEEYEPEPEPA